MTPSFLLKNFKVIFIHSVHLGNNLCDVKFFIETRIEMKFCNINFVLVKFIWAV